MSKKKRKNKPIRIHLSAFTLIELLAVIAIFVLIRSIIVSILFIGLRGARKSDLLDQIRQNGNVAMSQITRNIRFARSYSLNPPDPVSCLGPVPLTVQSVNVVSLTDSFQTKY